MGCAEADAAEVEAKLQQLRKSKGTMKARSQKQPPLHHTLGVTD